MSAQSPTLRQRHTAALALLRRFLELDDWSDELIAPADLIREARAMTAGDAVQTLRALADATATAAATLAAGPRFVTNAASRTVYDTRTGLTWMRETLAHGRAMTHQEALDECAALNFGGFTEWRLPTREELLSLVDPTRTDPAIDTAHFECKAGWYWSSSPYAGNPEYAWNVNFHNGYSYYGHRDYEGFVRAVRGPSPRASQ